MSALAEHCGPRGLLSAAFAELNENGIVARQEWACCQSCGCRAMEVEERERRAAGRPFRGYVFYNEQDAASSARTGKLRLSYGDMQTEAGSLEIAREVIETLEAFGLETEWEGTLGRKVMVKVGGYFGQAEEVRP